MLLSKPATSSLKQHGCRWLSLSLSCSMVTPSERWGRFIRPPVQNETELPGSMNAKVVITIFRLDLHCRYWQCRITGPNKTIRLHWHDSTNTSWLHLTPRLTIVKYKKYGNYNICFCGQSLSIFFTNRNHISKWCPAPQNKQTQSMAFTFMLHIIIFFYMSSCVQLDLMVDWCATCWTVLGLMVHSVSSPSRCSWAGPLKEGPSLRSAPCGAQSTWNPFTAQRRTASYSGKNQKPVSDSHCSNRQKSGAMIFLSRDSKEEGNWTLSSLKLEQGLDQPAY